MTALNFKPEDKAAVQQAGIYYDFTEEKTREIAAKNARDVTYEEWCSLLQMLYPSTLICSGLFDPFIVFEVKNGRRKDPPKEHWRNLDEPGSNGILFNRFIKAITEHGIVVHESWEQSCTKKDGG